MIGKRRGLILLATTALCAVALMPVHVGDARVPGWVEVFQGTSLVLKHAGTSLREAYLHFGWWHPADKPTQVAVAPGATQAGPVLDKPQATQDASALKQAYVAALSDERIRALGYDPANVGDAIAAYRADNLVAGDALAARIVDPLVRTALEWVALRDVPQKIGMERLQAFQHAHSDWPTPTWFRHQEEARTARMQAPDAVMRFYASAAPVTAAGKFALAKALKTAGRVAEGSKLARALFRESDLQPYLELRLKADFGPDLTRGDYKYKADRLMYKEQVGAAMRYAVGAGPDVVALEKARAAVIAEGPSDKAIAAVPESLRKDPGLLLAEVQKLRRADKLMDAANLMQSAPRDRSALIDGDEWWVERRMLTRKLLDNGNINAAYVIAATASPTSSEDRIDAEFHAGWIALRFMNDPPRAAYHFDQAAKLAETPTSIARIAYWQARTAAAVMAPDAISKSDALYRKAADYGATYYGQLAREALGLAGDPLHAPVGEAIGSERSEAVRSVELLYAAGDKDSATALAADMAGASRDVIAARTVDAGAAALTAADIAVAETVRFPLADGSLGHGFFYAPRNRHWIAPEGERPPLVVMAHGGPTAMANAALSLAVQWWTSRGIAVLDVNYGGSTGFGRAWRQRLDGAWGVVDVDDCVAACAALVGSGRVDPDRLAIRGSSAGGFTVLAALTRSTLFSAAACLYGIGDLRLLAADTHKFESRYLDRLIGELPGCAALYDSRSPIHNLEALRCPVIFFHGLEDKVVPVAQTRLMAEALRARGIAAEAHEFAGEAHGFRREETIRQVLESELAFYGSRFGFTPSAAGTSAPD